MFLRILLLAGLGACAKKESNPPVEIKGVEYYPLKEGRYSIYECDSTVYIEIPRDTIRYRYQVKEVLTSPFTDDAGQQAWRLERYMRWFDPITGYDSAAWKMKDVWQVNKTAKSVQVVEENVRYTKLSFPVKQGVQWNGNALNSQGEALYTYEYVDQRETVGTQEFERVLKVVGKDLRTLISYEYSAEKYAAGAGLVYRNYTNVFSNTIISGQTVEQRIEKGVIFTQQLISHGY